MSYESLMQQLDKLHRHTRQGSIQTRRRYYDGMRRFLLFLADEFKLQNIKNISDKHTVAYVAYLKQRRCGPNYIRTELAAVRFYYDQIEGRYRLTRINEALGVHPRPKSRDRSWSEEEVAAVVEAALSAGKTWMVDVIVLACELGLRIHEVIRLWRADAERALREGELKVEGKGGLVRSVPLTPAAAEALGRAKERVPRGARLFVPSDKKAHQAIKEVQDFIRRHRKPRPVQLTFHGLRYTDAQEHYRECLAAGKTREEAEKETARRLGHRRPRVTRTYVGPFA
ncbi:MAG: phage integrase N-terminal SAM-like domain-containing protein [Bacillota bacterium]